jgi:hypothetical protein
MIGSQIFAVITKPTVSRSSVVVQRFRYNVIAIVPIAGEQTHSSQRRSCSDLLWLDPAGHKMPDPFHYGDWSCGTTQVLLAFTTFPAASVAVLARV